MGKTTNKISETEDREKRTHTIKITENMLKKKNHTEQSFSDPWNKNVYH